LIPKLPKRFMERICTPPRPKKTLLSAEVRDSRAQVLAPVSGQDSGVHSRRGAVRAGRKQFGLPVLAELYSLSGSGTGTAHAGFRTKLAQRPGDNVHTSGFISWCCVLAKGVARVKSSSGMRGSRGCGVGGTHTWYTVESMRFLLGTWLQRSGLGSQGGHVPPVGSRPLDCPTAVPPQENSHKYSRVITGLIKGRPYVSGLFQWGFHLVRNGPGPLLCVGPTAQHGVEVRRDLTRRLRVAFDPPHLDGVGRLGREVLLVGGPVCTHHQPPNRQPSTSHGETNETMRQSTRPRRQ
jgi:hypothetical protein